MELKDYYQVLELNPTASMDDIKKSYRRMALAYHPDKNADDPYAAVRFAIVKEAYEVLTDPVKKQAYLEERWLAKASGKIKTVKQPDPESLLRKMIEKERAVAVMDKHRMDKNALLEDLLALFSSDAIDMLRGFNDVAANSQLVRLAIRCADPLPYTARERLYNQLSTLPTEFSVQSEINRSLKTQRLDEQWDRVKIWLLLFVVTAICILIFMVGR